MYDLIVIGDDLSSHVAAAVAASNGLKTVLLAEHGTGGVYLLGDYAFNIDPTPLTGFGINQTCRTLFSDLDIPLDEHEALLLNPAYQIIMPEHRIDFFNEKETMVKELAREFPAQAEEIIAFYESVTLNSSVFNQWQHDNPFILPRRLKDYYNFLKLTPHIIKHKMEMSKFEYVLKNNPSLKKIFEAQYALLSISEYNINNYSSTSLYCSPLHGVYYFRQGKQFIFNSLIKQLELKKGFYLSRCQILSIKKGKAVSIEVSDKDGNISSISAKYLIVSTKWKKMHLLLDSKKHVNFGEWINPVKVSHLPFTIHLGCNRKCLPEKMAVHLAIVSDVHKNIYDDNLIILESNLIEDERALAIKGTALTATVFLPNNPAMWAEEYLKNYSSSILDRLEYFLPFLKDNIEFFDPGKSIQLSKLSHSVFNPKYKFINLFINGFNARSNKTRFKNVFLTGASLLPSAGFDGEIISGRNALSRVISREI
jgi:phytoene dehydrogenase-like protein